MSEADAPDGLEELTNESSLNNDSPLKCTFPACPRQEPFPNRSTLQYELSPLSELDQVIDLSPRKHIDRHTRPFTCNNEDCAHLKFADKGGLSRHQREVHGSMTYSCPVTTCRRHKRGFPRKWNLQEHQRKLHSTSAQSYNNEQDSDDATAPQLAQKQHDTAFDGHELNHHDTGMTRDDKIKEMIRHLQQEKSKIEIRIMTLEAVLG
ncbi:hypothetical protein ACMFMF_006055 [Clarireedia jacksonii]